MRRPGSALLHRLLCSKSVLSQAGTRRTLTVGPGPGAVRLRSAKGLADGTAPDPLFNRVKPTAVTVLPFAAPPTVLMTTAGSCAASWLPCRGTGS